MLHYWHVCADLLTTCLCCCWQRVCAALLTTCLCCSVTTIRVGLWSWLLLNFVFHVAVLTSRIWTPLSVRSKWCHYEGSYLFEYYWLDLDNVSLFILDSPVRPNRGRSDILASKGRLPVEGCVWTTPCSNITPRLRTANIHSTSSTQEDKLLWGGLLLV